MAKLAAITRRYDIYYYPSTFITNYQHPAALIFVLAPLPNALFSHCGSDELSSYESSAPIDLGRFITALFVVTGFALPIVLAHSHVIDPKACVMSITGGGYAVNNFDLSQN